MKRLLFSVLFLLALPCFAVTTWYSKAGATLFSGASAWNTAANGSGTNGTFNATEASSDLKSGDTLVIQATHSLTYDVTNTAFTGGFVLTVNGTVTASTTAGTYYLKCGGHITVNSGGSFLVGTVGTAYPATCTFTVNLNGAYYFTGAGTIAIYCSEPTVRTLQLNTATAADATVLDVRLVGGATWDPTADAGNWVSAQTVRCDQYGAVSSTVRTIASTASNQLTLNAGTMPIKAVGSLIHLINRNVWVTGATGYACSSATALTIAAQLSGNANGIISCTGVTVSGGTISGSTYGIYFCTGVTVSGGTISGNTYGINSCTGVTVSGGTISGSTNGLISCTGVTVSGGTISGNTYGLISCNTYGLISCTGVTVSGGTISGSTYGLYCCTGVLYNVVLASTTFDIYACPSIIMRNVALTANKEVSQHNTGLALPSNYISARDYNQSAGAYKSWTKGGITLKQAVTYPTGYTYAYQLTCESAASWGFYQQEYTVAPGETKRFVVYRTQSVDTAGKAEIVGLGNDPLVGGTALASTTFGTDTGAWGAYTIQYTNGNNYLLAVQLRVSGKAASGTLTFLPVAVLGHESW